MNSGFVDNPIINLTQHFPTPAQLKAGVIEPAAKERIKSYLTFEGIPTEMGMKSRAEKLALYVRGCGFKKAMIGGIPCFMPVLEKALLDQGVTVCYAFSERKSQDKQMPDGSVQKVAVFEHKGFYEVEPKVN